jgi:hypothetical protein
MKKITPSHFLQTRILPRDGVWVIFNNGKLLFTRSSHTVEAPYSYTDAGYIQAILKGSRVCDQI